MATEDEATFEAHLEGMDCGKRPCTVCEAPVNILAPDFDYQDLLVRYLMHVQLRLDNDFLEREDRDATAKYVEFQDKEWDELKRLSNLED